MEKNYIDYDAVTFAADPSFIKWVRYQQPEAIRFWEDWQKGHPEKIETNKANLEKEYGSITIDLKTGEYSIIEQEDNGELAVVKAED